HADDFRDGGAGMGAEPGPAHGPVAIRVLARRDARAFGRRAPLDRTPAARAAARSWPGLSVAKPWGGPQSVTATSTGDSLKRPWRCLECPECRAVPAVALLQPGQGGATSGRAAFA